MSWEMHGAAKKIADGWYSELEAGRKRNAVLGRDNAKLRDELDAAKHDLSLFSERIVELGAENAKLRELVCDMLPFAEVGMDDACVTRRCCLFEQCEHVVGVKCAIEQHMIDRMRELGVEVDE